VNAIRLAFAHAKNRSCHSCRHSPPYFPDRFRCISNYSRLRFPGYRSSLNRVGIVLPPAVLACHYNNICLPEDFFRSVIRDAWGEMMQSTMHYRNGSVSSLNIFRYSSYTNSRCRSLPVSSRTIPNSVRCLTDVATVGRVPPIQF